MRFMLISGSISSSSHTRELMNSLAQNLTSLEHEVDIWDFQTSQLPIAQPEFHWAPEQNPDGAVQRFYDSVRRADGLAIGSPLYHGSYSGVLKNALDHLWYDAFRNKPVGLLSHGSSIRLCAQPCEHLQTIIRTLYGHPLQTHVATTKTDYELVGGQPHLISPEILRRVERLALEMIALVPPLKALVF
ncbi:NADPH-dependent FMN reductase [Agrobacterium vitis]|uniref:NADPH-dependent FMN reductase n=1 Tax=Agrobacterium vitis TaxID=373 RepID=UPI0015D6CC85|nr:NADPH-dependent FMN reductase [Agrobacterium vitis]